MEIVETQNNATKDGKRINLLKDIVCKLSADSSGSPAGSP